ncbi:MAG TPA: SWIM zinc finger family protein [Flavisolibacter sp.]|nr:SWIM zinc finger family protein [Flavisolibacter sp.]
MNLTEDQILTLAPDESSKKSGKDLANPAKWVTKGASENAVWGECQGSGSKPYQAGIDLSNLAFKCSCPSRKFPCKHGIALGLLYVRQAASFTTTEAPAWITEWIAKRSQREETKTEKKEKPVDEAAQAKRQKAREQKVTDGVEELLLWIKDIVRGGIINVPDKPSNFWEGMARRMVDAQAPGIAGMIRTLGNTTFYRDGWQSLFLDNLLNLYLIAKGYKNRDQLSTASLQDVRNWIGFTINQEEVKEQTGVLDTWLVIGKQVSEEDNLTIERNWLYGMSSNQYALVLQFLIRGQGATLLLSPGLYIEAEIVFLPSVTPLRAIIKRHIGSSAKGQLQFFSSWLMIAQAETSLCSSFPVRSERPYALSKVTPVHYNNAWWLKDDKHQLVQLKESYAGLWQLLSLSGGHPLDMVVIGKERNYEPLGVWADQTYKPL